MEKSNVMHAVYYKQVHSLKPNILSIAWIALVILVIPRPDNILLKFQMWKRKISQPKNGSPSLRPFYFSRQPPKMVERKKRNEERKHSSCIHAIK